MANYTVTDPKGVYEGQTVQMPFSIPVRLLAPVDKLKIKTEAIKGMYGCPLHQVDKTHAREMLDTVEINGPIH